MNRGNSYLAENKFAEARIEFRSALQIDRKLAEAHYGLGEAALALGYVQEAAEAFYSTMRLDPENLQARVRVGSLLAQYSDKESLKEAERLANEVLDRNPNHIEGRILLANIHTAGKNWDEAEVVLKQTLEQAPGNLQALLSQAAYYSRRADSEPGLKNVFLEKAESGYSNIIAKNPQSSNARLAYGDFLFAAGREAEAEKQLIEAHKSNPRDKFILLALQRFYESRKNYTEAEKYLSRLVDLDSNKSEGRAQIIDLHARRGDINRAVSDYRQLLRDDPKFLPGYSRLAELLSEAGDIKGALQQVEDALKLNSRDTDALLMRGRLYTLSGRYREAASDLDQVLRFEPYLPSAIYYAANAFLQNNDPARARLLVNRLLSFYPRNPMGLLLMARIQLSEERPYEAAKTATQAIVSINEISKAGPGSGGLPLPANSLPEWESKAYVSRAVARMQTDDFDKAKADLEKSIQIGPTTSEPHVNMAAIHLAQGDLNNALTSARRAVELGPGNISAVTTLVNVYLAKKDYDSAHAALDRLLKDNPGNSRLLEQKARVFEAQGDRQNTEKVLRTIIELNPEDLNAYFALSDFYSKSQDQVEKAISELKTIIEKQPASTTSLAQAHLFAGLLEEGRGKYDEAIRHYENMLGYDRRSVGAAIAMNNLSWLYADKNKGNLDKAADYSRRAIAILPEAGFYDTLGYVHYKKGQYEVAIDQFNKAIDKRPSNPTYRMNLARAWRENGNRVKAKQAFEKALNLASNDKDLSIQLKRELAELTQND